MNNKITSNRVIMMLVTFFFGYLGIHKLFQKKYGMAIVYFFTGGLFGFGYLFDVVLAIVNIFTPLDYFRCRGYEDKYNDLANEEDYADKLYEEDIEIDDVDVDVDTTLDSDSSFEDDCYYDDEDL